MDKPCPFCGSEKLIIDTPHLELKEDGEYRPKTTFCCNAQRKNNQYIKKRFSPYDTNKPSLDEVSES